MLCQVYIDAARCLEIISSHTKFKQINLKADKTAFIISRSFVFFIIQLLLFFYNSAA